MSRGTHYQGWVRADTRSIYALATLNLCFFPKLRCTCQRKDEGQHIINKECELVKKEMSIIGSTYLDLKEIKLSFGSVHFRVDVCYYSNKVL